LIYGGFSEFSIRWQGLRLVTFPPYLNYDIALLMTRAYRMTLLRCFKINVRWVR